MNEAYRYPANVFWSDEDEGFIAVALDLPGCSAFGETQDQALSELQDAIEAWIQAARAAGNPVPKPSIPAVESQHSGKLLVRMPRSLHADLAEAAKREEVSLNQFVVFLLSRGVTYRTFETHLVQQAHVLKNAFVLLSKGPVQQQATTSGHFAALKTVFPENWLSFVPSVSPSPPIVWQPVGVGNG